MRTAIKLSLCSLLFLPSAIGQTVVDLSLNVYTFTGERTSKLMPDVGLLEDREVNSIANACIAGATRSELAKLNVSDLDSKLKQMLDGNIIVENNGHFVLTFPVIHDETRDELQSLAEAKAHRLTPAVAAMLNEIYRELPTDRGLGFHILWSRVMDRMWYPAWRSDMRSGNGPPFTTWAIFPESLNAVGTASYDGALGGGSNAKTWSHGSICGAFHPRDHQAELLRGAWGHSVDPALIKDLEPLGVFDHQGRFTGFAYHAGDSLDALIAKLTGQYGSLVAHAYDYEALSMKWRVPPDELWIILQHETAYAILGELVSTGKLIEPSALMGGSNLRDCRNVISLRLVNPPQTAPESK